MMYVRIIITVRDYKQYWFWNSGFIICCVLCLRAQRASTLVVPSCWSPPCSQPSGSLLSSVTRDICAQTDNLLRMRKDKKFSMLCSQPSGSLLSSVTRDICAQTQTFYCAFAKLRNLAYYAASPAAACSRLSRGTSAHRHRHFTAHSQS